MSSYKGTYTNEQSYGIALPIIAMLFIGAVYFLSQRSDAGFASFILVGAAAITMIYWVRMLQKIAKDHKPAYTKAREQESKNWMYDLMKGENESIFVAEVPGPEDKIAVRLIDGVLYIRGSGGFGKEVPIQGAEQMQIVDFKYRNGVLTLRIR